VNYTDPEGLLAPPWHFGITSVAALSTGHGKVKTNTCRNIFCKIQVAILSTVHRIVKSLNLAWNVMAVDFVEGSQETNWEATRQHAMA